MSALSIIFLSVVCFVGGVMLGVPVGERRVSDRIAAEAQRRLDQATDENPDEEPKS